MRFKVVTMAGVGALLSSRPALRIAVTHARRYSDMKKHKIGFVGLGNMGFNMCKNLLQQKHDVMVKDLSPEKEQLLAKEGAKVALELKDLAKHAEIIVTMLPASQHVEKLYHSDEGLIKFLKKDTLAIDCSTVDFTTPIALGESLRKIGVLFIDAPVSGGVPAAEKGTLTFMVGGEKEVLSRSEPILLAMGSKIIHCGSLGTGQIAKMCNNLLLAITATGASEVFDLGTRLGMDPKLLSSVINNSSGRCWVTDTYHPVPNVLENVPSSNGYKAGFSSEMILKDIKIAEKAAANANCTLTLGKTVLEIYSSICKSGSSGKDFTVVYDFLRNKK